MSHTHSHWMVAGWRFRATIRKWRCLCLASCLLTASTVWAQLPTAQLTSVFPAGGKQGATFDVALTGVDLEDASALHFSHPGITAQPKMQDVPGMPKRPAPKLFTVTVAADVPTGLYEARVVSKYGISNPRAFLIGDRTEFTETEPNNKPETANQVALNTIVNGHADVEGLDYFKFTAKQGQRIIIDCWSLRLDSRMSAALVLFDAAGKELDRKAETNRLDPVMDFTAPADGDYFLQVYDFLYRGGDEYFYRLAIHTGPHIDYVFPPAGAPGSKGQYTLYGRNLPGGTPAKDVAIDGKPLEQLSVQIELPSDPAQQATLPLTGFVEPSDAGMDGFAYRLKSPQGESNAINIGYATAPVVLEQEPNNDPAHAQKLTIPCEVAGQFNPRGDQDWYTFDAKKGETLWIEVMSERLGLPTDPYLYIQRVAINDKGVEQITEVADVDDPKPVVNRQDNQPNGLGNFDTSTQDPNFKLVVPEDGTYRLLVRDLYFGSRGSPAYIYRLAIRHELPDFRLVAVADPPFDEKNGNGATKIWSPLLYKAGAVGIKVIAFRRDDFPGEIEVSAEGLPPGVHCPPILLGSGSMFGTLILTADENAAAWSGSLKIVGKSKIAGADVVRQARGGSIVWGTANRQVELPRSRMTGDVAVAVSGTETQPVTIEAGNGQVLETSLGGKLEVPVKITRRGEFKGALKMSVVGLPQQLKPADLDMAAGASDSKITLDMKAGTPPGTYTFTLHAATQINYVRDPEGAKAAADISKEMDKVAADAAAAAKQATDAATAATKTATDATAALKAATDKLTAATAALSQKPQDQPTIDAKNAADKEVADATAKAKTAQDAKVAIDAAAAAATAKSKMADAEKAAAAQRAKDTAESSKPKQLNVIYFSTPVVVKVAAMPLTVTMGAPSGPLKAGEKVEIPVTIVRLYGFADPVEFTPTLPGSVTGVKVAPVTIPKDQTQGKFILEAGPKITGGEFNLPVKVKATFNGQQTLADQAVLVKIQ